MLFLNITKTYFQNINGKVNPSKEKVIAPEIGLHYRYG